MAAHQASPSRGFSRQEHWSGLPFPSPMHESEKLKVKLLSRVWPSVIPLVLIKMSVLFLVSNVFFLWIIIYNFICIPIIQKNIYFCFTDYTKAFDSLNHNKLWKFLKEMGINTTPPYLPPEKHMQVKKQQNWTRNNGLAQIWERSTSRLYFVTLLI